jgi:hypothetical protein
MLNQILNDVEGLKSNFNVLPFLSNPTVTAEVEIKRPAGYALHDDVALAVTAEADGFNATGYGEGSRDLAHRKAVSEAYERLALLKFCSDFGVSDTSSGWAANFTAELAIQSAVHELIERDVALTTWENGGRFYSVPETLWPKALLVWKLGRSSALEFSRLRILLSRNQNGACISALLFNERGNFVAGHSSALELQRAITSAASECFRAAHAAIQFDSFAEVTTLHAGGPGSKASPAAHSLAYAYKETLPSLVKIEDATEQAINDLWKSHQTTLRDLNLADLDVRAFQVGDRVIARVRGSRYRDIFWGRTNDRSKQNQHPHFVG